MDLRSENRDNESHDDELRNENEEYQRFISYFKQSRIPHPEHWPAKSPIYVTSSARAPYIKYDLKLEEKQRDNHSKIPSPFPLDGEVVSFNGPLFQGSIVSRMKDVPHSTVPSAVDEEIVRSDEYFKGRSRQFQWTVQGIFKKRTRFDQVVTGQDFGRPFRNAPATTLVKRGMDLLKNRLPDSFVCELFSEQPRFEHALIAGCQYFRIDQISTSTTDTASDHSLSNDDVTIKVEKHKHLSGENKRGDIKEDSTLLDDPEIPKDAEKRRKYFSKQENLEKHYYEPGFFVFIRFLC